MDKNYLINNGIDVNKSLELFGDMDMYNETLSEFLNGVNKKISDLNSAKESGDSHNYGIYAHSLKSDARYLGFTVLAELAYNHEMAGKNNDMDYVYNNYDAFMNELNRIITVVSKYNGVESKAVVEKSVKSDKTILVVDDSDIVTNFIKKIFNDTYNVEVADDGEEAITYINEDVDKKIIGMFLDLNMPNVDGYQVLEYFLKANLFDRIPVTIITGVDEKESISKALEYPVLDILSKPFNEKNIKASVEKMENRR